MSSPELQQLLQALQERNTGLAQDDIAWAFDAPKSQDEIKSWTRNYLSSTSLLTLEEHNFAVKHGLSKEVSFCQPVSDSSFEDAISSIEASTASIEKQCRLMEAQRQALARLRRQSGPTQDANGANSSHDSRVSRDRSRLEFDCSELADSLEAQLRAALKQAESSSGSANPSIERLLEKDDRLLDGLERVLPQLLGCSEAADSSAEVERLCQALTVFTSAEVRSRVDAAYFDVLRTQPAHANGVNGKATKYTKQLESLRAELDELCREIDGLSTMAVDNQYLNPITHATQAAQLESEAEKLAWTKYSTSTMQYITARMEYLHRHVDDQRAHTAATKTMSAALEEILAASLEKSDEPERHPKSPSKSSQKGLKPLRLVQANMSDSHDPTSQLLRLLDVRLPAGIDALALSKATADKREKLRSLRASSERGMSDQIAQSLSEIDADVQQFLDSVFAHSKHGTVHVESEDVRQGTVELESKTRALSEKMRDLDLDGLTKAARSKQQQLLTQLAED